jgi:hypothetical protein
MKKRRDVCSLVVYMQGSSHAESPPLEDTRRIVSKSRNPSPLHVILFPLFPCCRGGPEDPALRQPLKFVFPESIERH